MHAIFNFLTQNQKFNYLSLLLLITLLLFLIFWLHEPRRLINGFFFSSFILTFFVWITIIVFLSPYNILHICYGIIFSLIIGIIFLLLAFAWLFFLWNAYFVWKRESHTLPNLLTLIAGLFLILIWIIAIIGPARYLPNWLITILSAAPAIAIYLLIIMYNFLICSLLYQFVPRHYHADYLIVLGAGLINGDQVSPLLASRIDRALQFASKQQQKGRKLPKIIMSGGQGADESLPEAAAMAQYAVSHGYNRQLILLEDQSKNTYQNMLYSRKVIQKYHGNNNYQASFFSNNYHIFRAGLDAKRANLQANGIGAYTRFYYLPNAIIREFAGVFIMYKKRHFIIIGLIILLFILQALLLSLGLEKYFFI